MAAEVREAAGVGGAVGRRLLVAVGCEEYQHHARLRLVPATLATVAELFCGAGGLGYERVSLAVAGSPTEEELERALTGWFGDARLVPRDLVAIWFSGHGLVSRGRLRLAVRDSPANGGLDAGLFGRLLAGSGVKRALVIVDCCYAEGVAAGVLDSFERALDEATRQPEAEPDRFPDAGFVFVAANERAVAGPQGVLINALEYALRDRLLGGFTSPALDPRRVVQVVNERFEEQAVAGERRWAVVATGPGPGRFPPVFPNLHFRDVPATPGEVEGHWDPTAKGVAVEVPELDAWRFTGRDAALAELRRWVEDPEAGEALVVTGDPGSGKSAVLARVVTLSAPAYRARARRAGVLEDPPERTLPPEGAVGCAAWARQKTSEMLLAELHLGLAGERADPTVAVRDALATQLREREDPPLVVVDALDEAADPDGVATALAGLARAGLLRLVVATRRHDGDAPVAPALTALRPVVVDLDADEYLDAGDLVAYARRTIIETNAGYDETVALELAGRIAALAVNSFLFARILADSVAALAPVNDAAEVELPATIGAAIDGDLARRLAELPGDEAAGLVADRPISGAARRRGLQLAKDLLRPLARARGDGLPQAEAWAAAASAISGKAYADSDVEQHLPVLVPYIAETTDPLMGPCHRLNHDLVRAHFAATHLSDQEAERRITEALTRLVPHADGQPDWLADADRPAIHYARAHLAEHAAAAGKLDPLLENPAFLAAADPARLLPTLGAAESEATRAAAGTYQLGYHRLAAADRSTGAGLRRATAQLGLTARQLGADSLANGCASLELPFYAVWARWRRRAPHRVLLASTVPVLAIALGELGGRPVVVTGFADGTAQVTDLATSASIGEPLKGHAGGVTAVAVTQLDGRPLAVAGTGDGTVRVWDLATGTSVGGPLEGHTREVRPVAVGEVIGRPAVVAGSRDGWVRVWDLATGTLVGGLKSQADRAEAVAVGEFGGHPVAVVGLGDGTVRVWNIATGTRHLLATHAGAVSAITVAEPGGRPIAVTGSFDGTVSVWDLATGARGGAPPAPRPGWVSAVAVGELRGESIAVAGAEDGTVWVWDLATGTPLGSPLNGHTGEVLAVRTGRIGERPVAVTGSFDGTVRVWDLASWISDGGPPEGDNTDMHRMLRGRVSAVAVGQLGACPVTIAGSSDRTARVWDVATGAPVGQLLEGHTGDVLAVAVGQFTGQPVAVTASQDETVRVWDLATGEPVGETLRGHDGPVNAVAAGEFAGRPFAVTASQDETARVWDLATGRPLRRWSHGRLRGGTLKGHDDCVLAVAAGELGGRPIAVTGSRDCTVRVWDLATGGLIGQPFEGHTGEVLAVAVGDLGRRPVLVTGSDDRTGRVWDLATGDSVGDPLKGHRDPVTAVAVGELGGCPVAVTGSFDGTVRVWDLAGVSSRGGRAKVVAIDTCISAVALAPRDHLLVGGDDGVMALRLHASW